ncbi:restriction modification system DNA specificity domain [Rhodoferax ferrireducens T118]|uniref:Restriction modification system DNA specificity domain n=1 Tax=Albidiferax ferrireducens (strain ATCC BAA-621 / DSM 15236 / T118) TaxID=338969 RepID=Q21ZK2_ALBFT|nr:restriction endonuclease subunit S [Rhodoferax ferrireducens]ABD68801.1 restriction modification system DNA specificity domain [Rhodoferax ferrireducens T118]
MSGAATVTLSEFCATGSGGTPSRAQMERYYEGGTIPWIKSGELRETVINGAEEHVTDVALKESSIKLVPAGAILLAMYGATVGRLGILGIEATTNQAVCHIIPDPRIAVTRYVYHALSSQVPSLISMGVGGAQPNINQGIIKNLAIPLPAKPEQRRIAAILDQADALRAKRREALAQLDSLTQSIFIQMFGDPVSNPKGWPDATTLGQVANIASGVTKGRNLTGKVTRTIPYLAVANVQDKSLNLSAVKEIDATEDEIERYLLKWNDLLLTEGGDPDKLGRGTLWKNELPECIHQNHIFRVRVTSQAVTPLFLNWLVGSQRGKKYFLRSAKQTTGIASINMTQLRSFPLLLPPVELQRDFETIAEVVAEQHAIHSVSLAELEALFVSLQHRAFRGEL